MSDAIKHECGIAMVRLLKPLEYYHQKYGDALWGLNKLYLLMEKQHNRGQEGAGMATVKLNACPGEEYIFRERAEGTGAIQEIFSTIGRAITDYRKVEPEAVPESLPFAGEMYMGHLRYSTTGRSGISYLHPFLRRKYVITSLCIIQSDGIRHISPLPDDPLVNNPASLLKNN